MGPGDGPPVAGRCGRPTFTGRTLLVDRRTGTTTPHLWAEGDRPAVRETRDVDDWLTVIARCRLPAGAGRRAIAVRPAWWRDDPTRRAQAGVCATNIMCAIRQTKLLTILSG